MCNVSITIVTDVISLVTNRSNPIGVFAVLVTNPQHGHGAVVFVRVADLPALLIDAQRYDGEMSLCLKTKASKSRFSSLIGISFTRDSYSRRAADGYAICGNHMFEEACKVFVEGL